MKNLNIVKSKDADYYFERNFKSKNNKLKPKANSSDYFKIYPGLIKELIDSNSIKPRSILEIGCANGSKLNLYEKLLKTKINYGVDLSEQAIKDGKKKYKNLKLLNLSSLKIDKIKIKFDLIVCGFFLYLLDREEIFKQFDLIHKKLNDNKYLIINDFNPLFKHTNKNMHNKNLKTYKMNYDNFLEESGLFKIIYKKNYILNSKKKYKSDDASLTLYKKIDFTKTYPENIDFVK